MVEGLVHTEHHNVTDISVGYIGVPPGSILGPLLFALFIAPLEQVVLQK